jgi:hypothetical protein
MPALAQHARPADPSATQEEMAARLPAPKMIIRLDGGHVPAVTDPERFAFLLASAGG